MRKFVGLAFIAVVGLLMPRPVAAGPLVNNAELDFNGSVRITFEGMIDWIPPIGGGNGTATVQPTSTLSFAALAGTTVTEQDLSAALFPTGPAGTFAPLANFETLAAQPTTNFTLTGINACTINCVAGATSPFNFVEIPSGNPNAPINTTVILSMFGTATDAVLNPGQSFTWSGTWSADFPGQTGAQIVAQLSGPGAFVDAPYSAAKVTFTQVSGIPEPATLLTFGVGIALTATAVRRRRAAKV
jgi:hypothetical protein